MPQRDQLYFALKTNKGGLPRLAGVRLKPLSNFTEHALQTHANDVW